MGSSSRDLIRYDLFGWDYAAINPLSEEEVNWYLRWAGETRDPILGLACGSARLLCRLAEEGHSVTGIDLSETMLRIARSYAAALPPDARERVRLVRSDMASFELGERFRLVLIPDNSFRELPTRGLLGQCLRAIRRHLMPEGKLLITERRFRPEMYPDGVRRFGWSERKRDPETGDLVRRRGYVRLHKGNRRISGEFEYKVTSASGKVRTVRCPLSAPILELDEYLSIFGGAGFETQVFSDYRTAKDAGDGSLWCFVCTVADGK